MAAQPAKKPRDKRQYRTIEPQPKPADGIRSVMQ